MDTQNFKTVVYGYSVLTSSDVARGFKPLSRQTKDNQIGICCFSNKQAKLWHKNKDWLAQNNVFEWSEMSIEWSEMSIEWSDMSIEWSDMSIVERHVFSGATCLSPTLVS
jgi:hypothetical protein